MANKKAKKGKGKARGTTKPNDAKQGPEATRQSPDLDALRKPVLAAKAKLDAGEAEAKQLADKARSIAAQAKQAYREALAPYRQACSKAGVECEFEGGRSANVSAKVSFIVEKTDKGVRVAVKGKPESEWGTRAGHWLTG